MKYLLYIALSLISFSSCQIHSKEYVRDAAETSPLHTKDLDPLWYQGKAELNSFKLEQVRYGELRQGEAVLVFVAEDFSKSKQVKLDHPPTNPEEKMPVLKLNMTKNFQTGIYPYQLILSVFNPVGKSSSLYPVKTSCSVSEWCGQVYTQLNYQMNEYKIQQFSYFESEGDQLLRLPSSWTEDGIWNLIRINPDLLPTGKIQILPGLFYLRLKHKPIAMKTAEIKLIKKEIGVNEYQIHYPEDQRSLSIHFSASAPYPILSWTEEYPEGDVRMKTSAYLKKRIQLDYWNYNSNKDSVLRSQLQ